MAPTRGRKAAPASSPLSSPPSSPSLPDSPVKPKRAPKTEPKAKAAPKPRAKAPVAQAVSLVPEEAAASLDELLGNMGRDFTQRHKRDKDRRKTMEYIEREPDSVLKRPPPKPKVTAKRKRGQNEPQATGESDVAQPTTPSRRRGGASVEGDDDGESHSSPLTNTQASPSTSLSITPPPPSSPPAVPRLAGASTTRYSSDGGSDDEANDLDTALQRFKARPTKPANGADDDDDEDLSDPPSPSWKPTKLPPTVEIGDTCLVKVNHQWFPARLLSFTPATDETGKDLYTVETQDGLVSQPRRDRRYPSRHHLLWLYEDAVAKASIGVYEAFVPKSTNGQADPSEDEGSPYEHFRNKSHTAQVESLHGHLADLISERYAPAQWRIDRFFGTSADRQSLAGEVDYGDFAQRDTENEISPALKAWVEREPEANDGAAGSSSVPGDTAPNGDDAIHLRPRGSPRFEALTQSEQLRYTEDILLPEILLRICLCSLDLDRPSSWTRVPDEVSARASASAPAEAPGPAAAEATVAGDDARTAAEEARLYTLARKKLKELADDDRQRQWEKRRFEVQMAQKTARARLGMSEQRETKVNARAERMLRRDAEHELSLQQAYDRLNERKKRGKKGKGAAGQGEA